MTQLQQEQDANETVRVVYQDIKKHFGMVPNLFKVMAAADPDWLAVNWQREKAIMLEAGTLDRKTRELIAMTVSIVNHCDYCTLAHETMARQLGATAEEIHHAKQIIELFSGFNAIVKSYPGIPCDIHPKE